MSQTAPRISLPIQCRTGLSLLVKQSLSSLRSQRVSPTLVVGVMLRTRRRTGLSLPVQQSRSSLRTQRESLIWYLPSCSSSSGTQGSPVRRRSSRRALHELTGRPASFSFANFNPYLSTACIFWGAINLCSLAAVPCLKLLLGSSLGSGHIPGLEPSPRTASQNMLTIAFRLNVRVNSWNDVLLTRFGRSTIR